MTAENKIPVPLLFNPLKHYLAFIREFIDSNMSIGKAADSKELVRKIRHIGNCVMDIYTGTLTQERIFEEVGLFLDSSGLRERERFKSWVGTGYKDFRIITLSDTSQWVLKYHDNEMRFVHIFPARLSPQTFRIKANTLKSAILYLIVIGNDFLTEKDLNKARALANLSPVREVADTEAIYEMIEILRS